VAALLKKSTDLLDSHTLDCYAFLGVFPHKPATFSADAMKSVWNVDDPSPTIRTLVDRGLLSQAQRTVLDARYSRDTHTLSSKIVGVLLGAHTG
jgi:hypothetical protein